MNEIEHKFKLGEEVSFQKKTGIVLAQERSYGLPTYQVKVSDEIYTLCERDIDSL